MALGLAAIVYRAKKRFAMIEPDSALIVLTYALAIWILYTRRSSRGRLMGLAESLLNVGLTASATRRMPIQHWRER